MTAMPTSTFTPLRREDPVLLTGRGTFTGDVVVPGALHAVFVRSPMPHGRLVPIDTQRAEKSPGVVAVLTAATLMPAGQAVYLPQPNPLLPIKHVPQLEVLARDEVSYVGQPIALVVARSPAEAQLAAQTLEIDIEPLTPVLDFASTESVTQVLHQFEDSDHAQAEHDAAKPCVQASITSEVDLDVPRVLALSMEPRGMLAQWVHASDDSPESLTVWVGSQSPSRAQADIAAALAWPAARVRVISGHVGGAFGAKSSVCPEDLVIALAARHLRASVRWQSTRSEEFTSGMHGRGARLKASLSLSADGRFDALAADLHFTMGAWLPFSAFAPLRNAARILPGPYRVARLDVRGRASLAHGAPVTIYRGAGRPEAALLMETLVEQAARAAGMDPVALRRLNLVEASAMPYTTPTGEVFDSGDYLRALTQACERFDYEDQRQLQAERRAQGEVVGIGLALYVEPCGTGWESAQVDWHKDGTVTVATGSPAQGQGHGTTYARIAAQALGLDSQVVTVLYGDTALCPPGVGALASRSTAIAGSAIVQACNELKARRAAGEALPLSAGGRFTAAESWSYGCVIARMSLDRDTGRPTIEHIVWVDDAGHIVHPELAKGQLIGGLAQGLGQAMFEKLVYDDAGQLITGSLMDYAVPRADDIPAIDIQSFAIPSPNNLLGAKGVGEAGCIGVPAALMNAARDALSPLGECPLQFPLTAEQFWRAMNDQA
jgi:carbon-monoxide dehydrogenase large subunit